MSWRFRKTRKMRDVKLNSTRHGVSATLDAAPFSINVGQRGIYRNLSIPGTGLSSRERIDRPFPPVADPHVPSPAVTPAPEVGRGGTPPRSTSHVTEIRSAGTELLNSENLEALRKLFSEAYEERETLSAELTGAEQERATAAARYRSWEQGFLFRRVFTSAFAARKAMSETADAKYEELREQLRLATVATQIDIDREQTGPYDNMRDDFAALSESRIIWDTLDRRSTDRARERSAASEAITRAPVTFSLNSCDLIQWDQQVPHLPNRTGGDMYIYPGFLLYRASRHAFALIDSREVQLRYRPQQFIEKQTIPADAKVVGQAWAKCNQDGSPDRRFRDNYQIPVALYGNLIFTSPSGLHEEYQVSNCVLAERFATGWNRFQTSLSTPRTLNQTISRAAAIDVETNLLSEEADPAKVFVDESERARALVSVSERGPYWEFLLTEELLRGKLASLQRAYETIDTTVIPSVTRQFGGREFIKWFVERSGEPGPIRSRLRAYVNHDLPASWGEPGEAGDPIKILAAVNGLVGCCRDFAKWELDIYLAELPEKLQPLSRAARGFAVQAINEVNRIPDELARAVDRARSGKRNVKVNLAFTGPPQADRLVAEIKTIAERWQATTELDECGISRRATHRPSR